MLAEDGEKSNLGTPDGPTVQEEINRGILASLADMRKAIADLSGQMERQRSTSRSTQASSRGRQRPRRDDRDDRSDGSPVNISPRYLPNMPDFIHQPLHRRPRNDEEATLVSDETPKEQTSYERWRDGASQARVQVIPARPHRMTGAGGETKYADDVVDDIAIERSVARRMTSSKDASKGRPMAMPCCRSVVVEPLNVFCQVAGGFAHHTVCC